MMTLALKEKQKEFGQKRTRPAALALSNRRLSSFRLSAFSRASPAAFCIALHASASFSSDPLERLCSARTDV